MGLALCFITDLDQSVVVAIRMRRSCSHYYSLLSIAITSTFTTIHYRDMTMRPTFQHFDMIWILNTTKLLSGATPPRSATLPKRIQSAVDSAEKGRYASVRSRTARKYVLKQMKAPRRGADSPARHPLGLITATKWLHTPSTFLISSFILNNSSDRPYAGHKSRFRPLSVPADPSLNCRKSV